jgi:hypothetical protein
MTAQITENLRYMGRTRAMCTEPLEQYIELVHGVDRSGTPRSPYRDMDTCTALWRGYVGNWVICQGRLYLVGLFRPSWGEPVNLLHRRRLDMGLLFPGFEKRVFAHWYSGTLRVRDGQMLNYRHMGYMSVFERELLIEVERGVVTGTRIKDNRPDACGEEEGA